MLHFVCQSSWPAKYTEKIYGISADSDSANHPAVDSEAEFDIEADINSEVRELQKPRKEPLFRNVRLDVQCGVSETTRARF